MIDRRAVFSAPVQGATEGHPIAAIAGEHGEIAVCQLAWGPDADWPDGWLIWQDLSGSEAGACSHRGGMALMRGYPVERLYRDIRHDRVGEGCTEIQRTLIACDVPR